ncbi:MAG: hypothetical protein KKA05_10485 [Alphaproteobacteria bacterium]|nr:hypothetical protein [Alphaproteobacteria bacterium]MBU0860338.1 hypothetical protein [Alphaproteobacteria bacterium]
MADMANLSERLNTLADALADGHFHDNEDDAWTCYEAKTLIDRLTVEGLAREYGFIRARPCITNEEAAQALLTYITTPSAEQRT